MQKRLVPAFWLFLLFNAAFGAEISAPAQLPAGVAWSFSVALDPSNNFTKTIVSIGNAEILQAFSNSQVSPDPFNGGQVIKAFIVDADPNSTSGLVLYVSHIGLGSGQHTVKTVVMNNASVVETKEKTVSVVDVLPSSFEQQVKEKLGYLETSMNTKADSANAKIDAASRQLGAQAEQLKAEVAASSKKSDEAVNSMTAALNDAILEFQSATNKKLEEELAELKSALFPPPPETQLPSIGLLSLGQSSFTNIALILVAVLAVVGVSIFLKKRFLDNRGVSLPDFESAFEQVSVPKDYSSDSADEILGMTSKGKWAHEKPKD